MIQQPAKKQINLQPASVNSAKSSIAKFKLKLSILSHLHHHKSFIIGALFLAAGITALLLSIYTNSQIIALIGLGMTFWGALFILISPVRYVEGRADFLDPGFLPGTVARLVFAHCFLAGNAIRVIPNIGP